MPACWALAAAVAGTACRDLSLAADRVIAIEVVSAAPKVEEGDTLRLTARVLNGAGNVVSGATVSWAAADTAPGFTLDETTGLVTATRPGSWRVLAKVESLQSDPLTLTVTAQPDTVAAATLRVTMPAPSAVSPPLTVTVLDRTTTPGSHLGITGKAVTFQVIQPAGATGFFLTKDSVAGTDPRTAVATTAAGGAAQVTARRVSGQTQPDSAIVEARVTTARGGAVAGSPIRFVVLFPTN